MTTSVTEMDLEKDSQYNPLGFLFLGVFAVMAMISQLVMCCLWGSLALIGFNPFEEE